jgi:hypothetical protein
MPTPTTTTKAFCLASNDGDFSTLAECTRRSGHDGHHCDGHNQLAWEAHGEIDCPAGHDHGQPPNRQARRGTVTHPHRAQRRIRRAGRNGR